MAQTVIVTFPAPCPLPSARGLRAFARIIAEAEQRRQAEPTEQAA